MSRFVCLLGLLLAAARAEDARAQDVSLARLLLPGEGWHLLSLDIRSAGGLAADHHGNVYVSDPEGRRVLRIDRDGRSGVYVRTGGPIGALAVGPDGRLHGCRLDGGRLVTLTAEGKEETLVEGRGVRDLVLTGGGACYFTVPEERSVYRAGRDGKKRRVDEGIRLPSGLVLWPDEGTLVVGDAGGNRLYAFRVEEDGALRCKEGYYPLRVRRGETSGVGELTVDAAGNLYAATRDGVQVFDPTGRLSGVLLRPERGPVTAVCLGGPNRDRLHIICNGQVYVRKIRPAKGK